MGAAFSLVVHIYLIWCTKIYGHLIGNIISVLLQQLLFYFFRSPNPDIRKIFSNTFFISNILYSSGFLLVVLIYLSINRLTLRLLG